MNEDGEEPVSCKGNVRAKPIIGGITLLLIALGAEGVQAQMEAAPSQLRLEWSVDRDKRGRPWITGYVYNDEPRWAGNVLLRIEAVDATGESTDSTTGYVYGFVPPWGRSYFDLPAPRGSTYRVTVESFGWRSWGGP